MSSPRLNVPERDLAIVMRRLSHEIRNPLASLKAGIQLLQRLTRPEGEIAEYYASLLTQVGRIDRIVDGVHTLARLDLGEPRAVDVAKAVATAVAAAQASATRAGVSLRSDPGPHLELWIEPANLQTALTELINNAVQASPAGGDVLVSWESAEAGRVRVSVEDEGEGISQENADKVLRPFFTTQPQGRGLGLIMAMRIVHLADGTVEWNNMPRGGCRFSLVLPVAPA
jgi:two-component system, NtrC family, sensor histidine kinase HydH